MQEDPFFRFRTLPSRSAAAVALCSAGILLGMLSFAATTPVEITRANAGGLPDRENFLSASAKDSNRLPFGVPRPPEAFHPKSIPGYPSPDGQGASLSNGLAASFFPGLAGMPRRKESINGTNPLENSPFANRQPALTNVQRAPHSGSVPFASGAQTGWSIVSSPSPLSPQTNVLGSVACVSATDCWAVGYSYSYTKGFNQTLIERWDGISWLIVSSPDTGPAQDDFLAGVACVSATNCWAVGYSHSSTNDLYQTLIEHWDGTSWSIVTSPNISATQNNLLLGVTCASSANCWAVGYYLTAPPVSISTTNQTLIEHWDGNSWAIVTSPNNLSEQDNFLTGVTCASASDCWAVGYTHFNLVFRTLIEHWDGTSWTLVSSPNTNTALANFLGGVACASASNCWAVGYYQVIGPDFVYQTLIEHWDGNSWALVDSPNSSTAESNILSGVACVSTSDCWAVGYYANGNNPYHTLIERWDGTSWTVVPSPNTGATQHNRLYGVACVSASQCFSTGFSLTVGIAAQTLIERWSGTSWSIVPSPNANGPHADYLTSVTCVSSSNCWTAGYYLAGDTIQTLIEHWDGTSWTIVPSPNTSATQANYLASLTCASASNCWAVGYYLSDTLYRTLIEHWDGTSWTIVPSPNNTALPDTNNYLNGVACASPSECWAAGTFNTGNDVHTLIERWDGASWNIVPSPNTSNPYNVLNAVTCASASDCWVVGQYTDQTGNNGIQPLIEHWDGNSWAIVISPSTAPNNYHYLTGVACASSSACWAVGDYFNFNDGREESLTVRWDGTSWTIIPSPNDSGNNYVTAVTCASGADCWTVGSSGDPNNFFGSNSVHRTLTLHWDGVAWALIASPNSIGNNYPTYPNYLLGVTCASTSDCRAVGWWYAGGDIAKTLTLHYAAGAPPIPTSVVSRKMQGAASDFDIDLPLSGNPGIECRHGGAGNDYKIVLTFPNVVTFGGAAVTSGTGTIVNSGGSGSPQVTVELTAVANAQTITITLSGVNDGANAGDVAVRMAVLIGDTNGDRFVNSADISQTKSQSGQSVSASNFREDVTADGNVNSADIALVKSKSGTALP